MNVALRTPFYRGSDICLLTYAINDRNSFKALKQWREEFLKYADIEGEHFPFIVVGNKVSSLHCIFQYSPLVSSEYALLIIILSTIDFDFTCVPERCVGR